LSDAGCGGVGLFEKVDFGFLPFRGDPDRERGVL